MEIHGDNRGVIGDVHGDVLFNGSRSYRNFAERKQAARDYLEHLATDCRKLKLRSLDSKADDPTLQTKVGLESVYVALDTISVVEEADPVMVRWGSALTHHELAPHPARKLRTISAFEALAKANPPRILLLGRPGSGKTTFLNHLAFRLARHWLKPDGNWLEPLGEWATSPPNLLPVIVTLRQFVRSLPKKRVGQIGERGGSKEPASPSLKELCAFVTAQLEAHRLEACAPALESATGAGEAVWFFDGLDEVPSAALRTYVRDLVAAFIRRYPQTRVVLTCRIIPYQDPRWKLAGVPEFTLARLDDDKQRQFISAWFTAHREHCGMPPEEAQAKAWKLVQALRDPRRRDLRDMAGEPMLLTLMALLQTSNRELPENRAELYQQAVELLLKRWDDVRALDGTLLASLPRALEEVGSDHNDLQRVLWHLALHVQRDEFIRRTGGRERTDGRDTADIPQATLVRFLAWLHPEDSKDWAEKRLIPLIQERSGLLVDAGHDEEHQPVYAFPHRSFQEYLAGAALTDDPLYKPPRPGQPEPSEPTPFPQRAIELVEPGGYWHEVIRWLASRLTHVSNSASACLAFLKELAPEEPQSPTDWHRVWLAAEGLMEMRIEKARKERLGRELLLELPPLLVRLITEEKLPVIARAAAGRALGHLGDDRPGVGTKPSPAGRIPAERPDFAWCGPDPARPGEPFPEGAFLMGGDPKAFNSSKQPFRCTRIQQPFLLAKYPVTVAQYRLFVQAKGYENDAFWTPEGLAWRNGRADTSKWPGYLEEVKNRYLASDFPISAPEDYAADFQTPNHPRVGVSWFEAVAFCRWLDATYTAEELGLPGGWRVRLPTDAEWERAARWPNGLEDKRPRFFPWGDPHSDEELTRRCNWHWAGLQRTSAVGLFSPDGDSAGGLADLAGNVWEWCQSRAVEIRTQAAQAAYNQSSTLDEEAGDELRVLRGGSWGHDRHGDLRAATRNGARPAFRHVRYGFRLVGVPMPSEL